MPKTITFTIGDGNVEVETKGFKGAGCDAATKAFEEVLGGDVTSKKRTSEFYEKEPTVRLKAGG